MKLISTSALLLALLLPLAGYAQLAGHNTRVFRSTNNAMCDGRSLFPSSITPG